MAEEPACSLGLILERSMVSSISRIAFSALTINGSSGSPAGLEPASLTLAGRFEVFADGLEIDADLVEPYLIGIGFTGAILAAAVDLPDLELTAGFCFLLLVSETLVDGLAAAGFEDFNPAVFVLLLFTGNVFSRQKQQPTCLWP